MVDKMIDLDGRLGPLPVRVWGLILNFIGNALAVYGAIGLFQDGSRLPILIIGAGLTLICLLVLAKPSK
jgi:hypothetical protein